MWATHLAKYAAKHTISVLNYYNFETRIRTNLLYFPTLAIEHTSNQSLYTPELDPTPFGKKTNAIALSYVQYFIRGGMFEVRMSRGGGSMWFGRGRGYGIFQPRTTESVGGATAPSAPSPYPSSTAYVLCIFNTEQTYCVNMLIKIASVSNVLYNFRLGISIAYRKT